MTLDEAYDRICKAIDAGRPANGYLVVGGVRGMGGELAERVLRHLYGGEADLAAHPDIHRLSPEKKSRIISVEAMRQKMIAPMDMTSYQGGWKTGLILGADLLKEEAANAFLKTLEEPPPKTMFLLLTDAPDAVLPTIVSRTQRIDLPLSDGELSGEARDAVAEVFESSAPQGTFARSLAAKRLAEVLGGLKDEAEDEDVALVRKLFYKTVMGFVRRWMVEGRIPAHLAFRNVEAVEDAYRQSNERSMPDEMVLSFLMDRMTFP